MAAHRRQRPGCQQRKRGNLILPETGDAYGISLKEIPRRLGFLDNLKALTRVWVRASSSIVEVILHIDHHFVILISVLHKSNQRHQANEPGLVEEKRQQDSRGKNEKQEYKESDMLPAPLFLKVRLPLLKGKGTLPWRGLFFLPGIGKALPCQQFREADPKFPGQQLERFDVRQVISRFP